MLWTRCHVSGRCRRVSRKTYYGKKSERERRRFCRKTAVQLGGILLIDFRSLEASLWDSNPSSSAGSVFSVFSPEVSSSCSVPAAALASLLVCRLASEPWGSMRKKLTSMMIGRKADAKSVFLLLRPIEFVASAYAPAPISPAPPVPLPHAARLKGP